MVTHNAAKIVGWDSAVGTLEPTKRADLVVLSGTSTDPYEQLIRANELDINLVIIDGVPRFGLPKFMSVLGAKGEAVMIGGEKRTLLLEQLTQDPFVGGLKFSKAKSILQNAMAELPERAKALEQPIPAVLVGHKRAPVTWQLALDEDTAFAPRSDLRSQSKRQVQGQDAAYSGRNATFAEP